jgi:phosphohistidine phosphatase
MPKDEDPKRPLSDSGREDVKRVASFLARSGVSAGRVLHSGKLRALETALLLADVLGPGKVVEE